MKPIIFLLILLCLGCTNNKDQSKLSNSPQIVANEQSNFRIIVDQVEPDTVKGSIKAKAMGTIGDVPITINYYSPAVRGRIIWGGLVPYDQVWVTGAHRATNIEFKEDIKISEQIIPAGKYGLFTVPGKSNWVVILNKNWDQHLADNYDASQDIVRLNITPKNVDHQERLQYTVQSISDKEGMISIWWDKTLLEVPVTIQ